MSATIWRDVDADVESAVRHFRMADELCRQSDFGDKGFQGYIAAMALMHAMQSGYTSAEAALLRILSLLKEDRPVGGDWRHILIRRLSHPLDGELALPALLSAPLAAAMQEARSFRHRAVHVYDDFDIERFPPALKAERIIVEKLPDRCFSPGSGWLNVDLFHSE